MLHLVTIPDSQRAAERLAADLAWRGISYAPCTQYIHAAPAPAVPEQGFWGRTNNNQTELEASL